MERGIGDGGQGGLSEWEIVWIGEQVGTHPTSVPHQECCLSG